MKFQKILGLSLIAVALFVSVQLLQIGSRVPVAHADAAGAELCAMVAGAQLNICLGTPNHGNCYQAYGNALNACGFESIQNPGSRWCLNRLNHDVAACIGTNFDPEHVESCSGQYGAFDACVVKYNHDHFYQEIIPIDLPMEMYYTEDTLSPAVPLEIEEQ